MNNTSKTINFFKEIANIPRESGNETGMIEYLCNFAKERNLEYWYDDFKNVVIKKNTTDKEILILHAHTDMVCEKEEGMVIDFSNDTIRIESDGKFLKAKGTTLGADNGIGVAQILNVLDSDIPCNIEAVFTAEEETTMRGAYNLDKSRLKGKYLIGLDGFEENTIIVESACFYDIILKKDYKFDFCNIKNSFRISLNGLKGGHSGFDINKNHGNSNILLAQILGKLGDIWLSDFRGGTKFNVIPSSSSCEFMSVLSLEEIQQRCSEFNDININVNEISSIEKVISNEDSKAFINMIVNFNNGVICYNTDNNPTTSINLAVINLKTGTIKVGMRSSKKIEEKQCLEDLEKYSNKNNFKFEILAMQPGFESSKNSKLIKTLVKTCPIDYFSCEPTLKSVHIAVELGFFEGLDVAIISPNIQNAHSVNECVEVKSIEATDTWLKNFIKEFN